MSLLLVAASTRAADPLYLDQIIEMPLASLQAQFPGLRKEGCYRLGEGRFLLITMDKKDGKPWRVALTSASPCRKAEDGPLLDVQHRKGIGLGDSAVAIIEKMGRPDAAAEPETALKRLGETEYFYVCRVSEGCARHTSIFIRDGLVSAVAEWYSQ
ncbi:MAG TPA: hypothetical protein VGQ76_08000 [Thermoanaerobaculia bacterium]|jgi:hypothetical protein|nr:hypothetical protein [Thermoanaerobaculia bacterium]